MTFRAKLLQAILAVVVVTTAASLFIAQRQNTASYRAVVDELFQAETEAFRREHEARLDAAAEDAARLARSVRLFAALEARDPEVYKIAADEMRLGDFNFFRLLNAAGELIPPPPDARAGDLDERALRGSLVPNVIDPNASRMDVQLGFVEVARTDGTPVVHRVLSSPIVNFDARVGTLVLGQRMGRLGSGLRSSLWIGERLVGGNVPENLRMELAAALSTEPEDEGETDGGVFSAGEETYRYQRFFLNEGSTYPPAHLVSIFSMDEFEVQQRELALRIAGIGVLALAVAGLIGFTLARELARPVAALVSATRRIQQGDYGQQVPASSTKEMNTLAEAFNDMAAGLALKDRYHSVLQQVADPQVAEELIAGRVKLGGELREVTVMFCDIRQYTALTVGLRPEQVIGILNDHMGAMTRVVQAHGGVINQFAGDAIMALFGAPKSYGDDAERAVQCACAMMRERERLNVGAAHPVRIGIGIASGAMVAGCIGAENRSDYTVVGARVNLAARLSSVAVAGEILIDDETRRRIGASHLSETSPLQLKGFAEPVIAHRVATAAIAPA